MSGVRVTKLEHDPAGFWRARVSVGGTTIDCDNRFGSWQADVRPHKGARRMVRRFVLPPVAAELQLRVRRALRKEVATDD